jgi:hypothetical protein
MDVFVNLISFINFISYRYRYFTRHLNVELKIRLDIRPAPDIRYLPYTEYPVSGLLNGRISGRLGKSVPSGVSLKITKHDRQESVLLPLCTNNSSSPKINILKKLQ